MVKRAPIPFPLFKPVMLLAEFKKDQEKRCQVMMGAAKSKSQPPVVNCYVMKTPLKMVPVSKDAPTPTRLQQKPPPKPVPTSSVQPHAG